MTNIYQNPTRDLVLEIRDNGMSAWLTINSHTGLIDEKDILDLLDSAGIKAGFEDAQKYIRENNLEKEMGRAFPVAMCSQGQTSTKLRYYFETPAGLKLSDQTSPNALKDLSYVVPGTVLADYSSNLFDRQGSIYNIFGEIIPNEKIDLVSAHDQAGEAVNFDELRNSYIAQKTGYPFIDEEGHISILDSLLLSEASADIFPLHTPLNITFQGDLYNAEIVCGGSLTVNGKVNSCTLVADGDVSIWNDVESSGITSKANVEVKGRIIFCDNPGINCLGDINFTGAVSSRILCRGKVCFEQEISECRVVGDKGITGDHERGVIVSSNIQACGDIDIAGLGSVDEGANEVEITISPYYKTMLMLLTKELIRLKSGSDPDESQLSQLKEEIRACENELDFQLNNFLKRPREEKTHVIIHHDVHPVAQIRVLKHSYTIKSYQLGLELTEKD